MAAPDVKKLFAARKGVGREQQNAQDDRGV